MDRTEISDACWASLSPHVEKLARRGRKTDLRCFIAAVLWILRTGCPWRDLHERFGPWTRVYRRFRRWAVSGRFTQLHRALIEKLPDVALLLIDSTAVRAHGHAAGARGGMPAQALGRSRGGLGTKVHAAVSEGGRLLSVAFTGAQRSDIEQAEPLLGAVTVKYGAVVADKGYDSDRFVRFAAANNCAVVIPSRARRRKPRPLDKEMYRERNVVERFFGRVKQFRRIATRYDKTTASFASFFFVAVAMMHLAGWT